MSPAPLRVLGLLLALCLLPLSYAAAFERERESGPELILPGSQTLQPGQVIVLEWTSVQEVEELEILLSLDGGRTYPIWISPELAPGDRRFVWHVPLGLGPSVRMRIRYNRGGREIEGAPTASLAVSEAQAQPLGLPSPPESSPRASGNEQGGGRSPGADRSGRQDGPAAPEAERRIVSPPLERTPSRPHPAESRPAFVPLRA